MTDRIQGYALIQNMVVTANADGTIPLNAKVLAMFASVPGTSAEVEQAIWENIVSILHQSVKMTNPEAAR